MRDGDGVFVGVHVCGHWQGVDRYEEKECCGGRKYVAAFCKCDLKGVLDAGLCCAACKDRNEDGIGRDFSKFGMSSGV